MAGCVAATPRPGEKAPGTSEAAVSPVEEPISKEHGVMEGYRIGAGDILQVMVWKEPDASVPSVVVRPDGKIAVPLLKEVDVMGLTPAEAEQTITAGLSQFIHGADVTVVVTAIHSKRIYMVGAVKKEGPIPLQYHMSILQALSEAGGLTDYAKRKKIYVLRSANGKQYKLPFNYDAVIKGQDMRQNIWVEPDDTIVVPH
jgi:polysaccharide export outer membrane protein